MLFKKYDLSMYYLTLVFTFLFSLQARSLESAKEYEIKAVYLLNLGSFVRWPKEALQESQAFEICILGQDPFGADLDFVAKTKEMIQNHQIVVKRLSSITSAHACHLLFISDSEQLRLSGIFAKIKNQPILTVGDTDRFVVQGGMIQFYPLEGKIRLMMDPQSIEETGLKANANLLKIAKRIKR